MKYLGVILAVSAILVVGQVLASRNGNNGGKGVEVARKAVVVASVPAGKDSSRSARSMADKFRNFLEKLKETIRQGNSTLGVPALDPYTSEKLALDLNEDLFKGIIEATKFQLSGLSGYKIDKADFGLIPPKIIIGLTWPQLHSAGSYKINVTAFKNIKAWGDGRYKVILTDVAFETTVNLKVAGGVSITQMETSITLGRLEFSATGLFHDDNTSKIISEVISDMGPQLISDYQKELTSAVNEKATEFVNNYLKDKSLSEIIGLIG